MCKYGYLHMCASAHRSQKNTLDPLELESLEVACYLMWMLGYTLRPSKEQQVLLTIEAMPTSPLITFSQTYGPVSYYLWRNVHLDLLPIIIRCLECQDWGVWIPYMFGALTTHCIYDLITISTMIWATFSFCCFLDCVRVSLLYLHLFTFF